MEIPSVTWTEFKKLKASEIKELKSYCVTADCETLFFAIIPTDKGGMAIKDNIATHAEYLGSRSNSLGGNEIAVSVPVSE